MWEQLKLRINHVISEITFTGLDGYVAVFWAQQLESKTSSKPVVSYHKSWISSPLAHLVVNISGEVVVRTVV